MRRIKRTEPKKRAAGGKKCSIPTGSGARADEGINSDTIRK